MAETTNKPAAPPKTPAEQAKTPASKSAPAKTDAAKPQEKTAERTQAERLAPTAQATAPGQRLNTNDVEEALKAQNQADPKTMSKTAGLEDDGDGKDPFKGSAVTVYSRGMAGRRRAGYVFGPYGTVLKGDRLKGLTDQDKELLRTDPELIVVPGAIKGVAEADDTVQIRRGAGLSYPLGSHETATPAMSKAAEKGVALTHPSFAPPQSSTAASAASFNPSVQAAGNAVGGTPVEPTAKGSTGQGDGKTPQTSSTPVGDK